MALNPARFREPIKPIILGQGSFGLVSEALDLQTGHLVAVKSVNIQSDEDAIQKLIGEISLMKQFDHPNIVRYVGACRTESQVKIYLEFIAGGSLAKIISLFGAFPESLVKVYVNDVVRGLRYLHQRNIAHRDIKAENLLLSCQGVVKLADFGTSKQAEQTLTGTLAGTPWFMAPEVPTGQYDPLRADIWSLGITVIQLLAGKPPYSEDPRWARAPIPFLMFLSSSTAPVPIPDGVSAECADFINRCLQRVPQQRPSCDQLLNHPWLVGAGDVTSPNAHTAAPSPPAVIAPGVSPRQRPPSADRGLGTTPGATVNGSLLSVGNPFPGRVGSRPASAERPVAGALKPHHLPSMHAHGDASSNSSLYSQSSPQGQ